MTFHWAIAAEAAGLALLIGAIAALSLRGRREDLRGQPGWGAILAGLVALSLGTSSTRPWRSAGNSPRGLEATSQGPC